MKDRIVEIARMTTILAFAMSFGMPQRAEARENPLINSAQRTQTLAKGKILQLYGRCAHFSGEPIVPIDPEKETVIQLVEETRGDAILMKIVWTPEYPNEARTYNYDVDIDDNNGSGRYQIAAFLREVKTNSNQQVQEVPVEEIHGTLNCSGSI